MKTNPHNDPLDKLRKKAFYESIMETIKASRRARGLPEDLKDWTPEQLAEREKSWQILQKLDLFATPPPRLDAAKATEAGSSS